MTQNSSHDEIRMDDPMKLKISTLSNAPQPTTGIRLDCLGGDTVQSSD